VRGKPVSRLVEQIIATHPGGAADSVATAGRGLATQGHVAIATSEPHRVVAVVTDGSERFHVELSATGEGLLASCTCTTTASEQLCAHSYATAYITWERATQTA
jgi:uncharacterized Zn finger protein